ncbi:single-stranded DNA-binding protein [Massilia violaceinigra]|uniref:Single-stranded DNA-binding protein n=1 Tax=Massilia violaceinigra TaxID=2045208 RepID=A0ABY4AA69_9BURK|nr:single-stranded DNA-binding protein [Massilia violaceinigra]UOD31701.1 single-stranded DNA-binding protein [Massilia violaceinigra]
MAGKKSGKKIRETLHMNAGKAMIVNVRGRVEGCRTHGAKHYTMVLSPSVDAYSSPQLFEIGSEVQLGEVDDEISCSCVLGGFHQILYDRPTGHLCVDVKVHRDFHTLDFISFSK